MSDRDREEPSADLPASFGKYYLTEKLATGGMAELYLAKIVGPGGFEKPVVIKQIHPRLSGQRQFVDLFVAEAKTLVTLAHGNIVPVYELGVIDDTYFIAMDYIDGPTLYRLTEVMRRRGAAIEPAIAAWIIARMLEGLAYAHRKGEGVIHRDLSPRNVMLSRDGEVKLVDFGIAVTLGAEADDTGGSAPTGSFPYMSPEQVRRQPLTGQTDLFSVGVLAWEMLVGDRLFARPEPEATLQAVIDGDIARPSQLRPEIPARLDELVMRALERDLAARWASADDMLAALQRYLYGLDEPPGPRDVAALVARYCPPETRRLPTHLEVEDAAAEEPRPGPSTQVIPRDARPRARTETFATHVALDELLAGASPDEPATSVAARPAPAPAPAEDLDDPDRPIPRPERSAMGIPGREAPSQALLVIGALGAIGLGGATLYTFYRGRSAIERGDPALAHRDAGLANAIAPPDLPPDAPDASDANNVNHVNDAPAPDAGEPPPDAAPHAHLPDHRAPPDAAVAPPDAPPRPAGSATITIGANPWGDVVLDGKTIGHTPIEKLTVPAGHHTVKVTFGGDDPPRTQTYQLELANGDTRDLQADFTKP